MVRHQSARSCHPFSLIHHSGWKSGEIDSVFRGSNTNGLIDFAIGQAVLILSVSGGPLMNLLRFS